jgi:hypothetical protein
MRSSSEKRSKRPVSPRNGNDQKTRATAPNEIHQKVEKKERDPKWKKHGKSAQHGTVDRTATMKAKKKGKRTNPDPPTPTSKYSNGQFFMNIR